ncbi:MAG TPA: GNAT family N-acetyltransferase [Gaiellaceae bacterium]|nr:GNAT family N-acetyltransferase [Gaiellaceae bacterium]
MNVRRCQTHDVPAVARLLDEATVWVGERGYEQWPLPYPWEEIAAAVERGEVYLAELGGDVVATVTLLWDDTPHWGERPPDAAYVHKLAVSRACAGRRIGHAIVEWADATAAANGRFFLRLDCLRTNPGIRKYYEELGFEHRGDEIVNGRDLSLYERTVHARGN